MTAEEELIILKRLEKLESGIMRIENISLKKFSGKKNKATEKNILKKELLKQ